MADHHPEKGDMPLTPEDVGRVDDYCRRKTTATLAIVFTDIVDSTAIRERLGEPRYEEARENHEAQVNTIVAADDSGVIVKGTGDGVLAAFSEPSTAVERSLLIQDALKGDPHFRLRIGVDMGQVSTRSRGGVLTDVFGRQVNRAARIEAKAAPGEVVVSFPVYDCAVGWLHDRVSWRHLGPIALKGFAEPISLHAPYPIPKSDDCKDAEEDCTRIVAPRMREEVERQRPLTAAREWDSSRAEELREREDRESDRTVTLFIPASSECEPVPTILDPVERIRRGIRQVVDRRLLGARSYLWWRKRTPRRTNVLWVDDFPANNQFPRSVLEAAGCHIELATTTEEACRMLREYPYQIVITDMGRGDRPSAGLDLLIWLQNERLVVPTVVFTPQRAVVDYGEEARGLGALACTAGVISLLQAVQDALEGSA